MKIMVTGAQGQLGADVMRQLRALNITALGVDRDDFDLTDQDAVRSAVTAFQPDAIIHCAAYTAVDKAETEPDVCAAVNAGGTLNIVRAALTVGAKLVYISTDYVFSGKTEGLVETDAAYGALNVYGLSKQQGEEAVRSLMTRYFIVRTTWVFGVNGNNFVKTMLRLGAERQEVSVVRDQIASPTYSVDLARLLCDMVRTSRYGVYHATNPDTLTALVEYIQTHSNP